MRQEIRREASARMGQDIGSGRGGQHGFGQRPGGDRLVAELPPAAA